MRSEHRVGDRGVGADHHDNVRFAHGIEVLRAGGHAEGAFQTVAGWRVANAGAGVDVVVAERGAHQLLHHPHFLVGAARRGDAADGFATMLGLYGQQSPRRVVDGFLPTRFAPRIGGALADHRARDAFAVVRVPPREPPLHAGVAVVRLAILVRRHAHHLVAFQLGAQRTPDAAVSAGGVDAAIRHPVRHHGFLDERGRGARLHAGAARDAFGIHEGDGAGGHFGSEASPVDGQGEGALHFVARSHATGADDALGGIELKIGVGGIDRRVQVVGAAFVAHVAQTNGPRHILQLAVAVGGAGKAVERMIGDVELQHAAPHASDSLGLRAHHHVGRYRLGAGRQESAPTVHLHQTDATRSEGSQIVRGAELGYAQPRLEGGAQDRASRRRRHPLTVNDEGYLGGDVAVPRRRRRAVIRNRYRHDLAGPRRCRAWRPRQAAAPACKRNVR